MLHFFKKIQLLNYVFPPYQLHSRNELRNTNFDLNIPEYYLNEDLNGDALDLDEMQIDKIYQRS